MSSELTFVAFEGYGLLARGSASEVVTALWAAQGRAGAGRILAFAEESGAQTDFDLRGSLEESLARLPTHPRR
jgi:hypothetical protein